MPLRSASRRVTAAVVVARAAPTTATAQPTTEDAALASRIPEAFRNSCALVPPEARTPGAAAAVRCDPAATGGVEATYERYTTNAAMLERYRNLLLAGSPSGTQSDVGNCDTNRPAETTWNDGGWTLGRLACFTAPSGAATYVWTHVGNGIVVAATRADGDFAALSTWWSTAGPTGIAVESRLLAVGGPFPDPYEAGLIQDLVPVVARTCRRYALPRSRTMLQASLLCTGPPGADAGVLYRRFATKAATEAAYRGAVRRLKLPFDAPGRCRTGRRTETAWVSDRGAELGRIACGTHGGYASVVWFDRDQRIQGVAARKGTNITSLITWWRRRG